MIKAVLSAGPELRVALNVGPELREGAGGAETGAALELVACCRVVVVLRWGCGGGGWGSRCVLWDQI